MSYDTDIPRMVSTVYSCSYQKHHHDFLYVILLRLTVKVMVMVVKATVSSSKAAEER